VTWQISERVLKLLNLCLVVTWQISAQLRQKNEANATIQGAAAAKVRSRIAAAKHFVPIFDAMLVVSGTEKRAPRKRRNTTSKAKVKSQQQQQMNHCTEAARKVRRGGKCKIAEMSPERQAKVREQNRAASARKRANGGVELKKKESRDSHDNYIMRKVIVSGRRHHIRSSRSLFFLAHLL
jgi:hypothetical protein